jgi:hypothetical protein
VGSAFLDIGKGTVARFHFTGGPIDAPKSASKAFTTIGHAAMAWARLEAQVDALLIHVNQARHDPKLYNPNHPIGFRSKLKLLKTWFNKHPPLKPLAAEMREAVTCLKNLSTNRNLLLHAIMDSYDPTSERVDFTSTKSEGDDTFRIRAYSATLQDLETATAQVIQVNELLWRSITSKVFPAKPAPRH